MFKKKISEKEKGDAEREKATNIVIGQKHFPESGRPGWVFIFHNFFIIFFILFFSLFFRTPVASHII